MVSKFFKKCIQLCTSVRYCDQAAEIMKNWKMWWKWPFFGCVLDVLEVFSNSNAWSQLIAMDIYSTNIWRIFETSHSSGSILIRNLIFSTEFVIYGKIFSEKSMCFDMIIMNVPSTPHMLSFWFGPPFLQLWEANKQHQKHGQGNPVVQNKIIIQLLLCIYSLAF